MRHALTSCLMMLAAGCAYPSVALQVESWDMTTRDGVPYLVARLAKDAGLSQLLLDYPGRVNLWLGPSVGQPADCIIGLRQYIEDRHGVCFWLRLDALHQYNKKVLVSRPVALRLIVHWPFSYEVVATLDGLDPEDFGIR